MNPGYLDALPCPFCSNQTDSLKQFGVIQTVAALPFMAVSSTTVVRSCPRCLRAFIWKRCLVNGLTTLILGYVILIPYTLALTLATLRKGHSWPVKHGITPEMQLNRTWIYEPSRFDKLLALIAIPMCLLPGIGIVVCWGILWKVRWRTGWVFKTAEIASFLAYLVTAVTIGVYLDQTWRKHR